MKIDINKKYRTIGGEYVDIERICFGEVYGVIHTPSGDVFTIWWGEDGVIFKSEHIEMDLESDKLNLVEIVEEDSATFSEKPVTWDVFTEYQELQNMELARLNNELVDLRGSRDKLSRWCVDNGKKLLQHESDIGNLKILGDRNLKTQIIIAVIWVVGAFILVACK